MPYAILATYRGGAREQEICRVGTEISANAIAAKLSAETYSEKLPNKKRAHAVKRYLSVHVQKVDAGPSMADPPFAPPPDDGARHV